MLKNFIQHTLWLKTHLIITDLDERLQCTLDGVPATLTIHSVTDDSFVFLWESETPPPFEVAQALLAKVQDAAKPIPMARYCHTAQATLLPHGAFQITISHFNTTLDTLHNSLAAINVLFEHSGRGCLALPKTEMELLPVVVLHRAEWFADPEFMDWLNAPSTCVMTYHQKNTPPEEADLVVWVDPCLSGEGDASDMPARFWREILQATHLACQSRRFASHIPVRIMNTPL